VVSGVCDGFIGNRMIEQYSRQAGFLLDEGCTPAQVDKAIEKFGFAMGPFRMGDLAGNDIGWAIRKRRAVEQADMKYSKTADLLCELGRYGQKTGAGWYDYVPGKRDAIPSPLVVEMIESTAELGITPRKISDDEIVQRLVFSLVNEARTSWKRASPARPATSTWSTSPATASRCTAAAPCATPTQVGLFNVVQAMKRFARNPHDDAAFWQPAPLLAKLAAEGKSFS
jgi:3-hydroxyacyl-CoA dehydrogenase